MPLQKGQVVLLDGPGIRSSVSGQTGVLLERDAATGRYRARLCAKPWKCVKVTRAAIRPLDTSEDGGAENAEGGHTAENFFGEPAAKCDYSLGAVKKARPLALPANVKDVMGNWPPSPVRRGQMQNDRPLPRIQQGALYRSIEKDAPHAPNDRCEVHRRRCYMYTSVQDSDLMDFAGGLPARAAPVTRDRPHRLLPHVSSQALKALVEEDHQAELNRKKEQTRHTTSVVPLKEPVLTIDHRTEEEIDERLGNLEQRAEEEAKNELAKRFSMEKATVAARQNVVREEEAVRGPPAMLEEASVEAAEESEEQRIFREFMEYEMTSPSHLPDASTPKKDASCLLGFFADAGCEADKGKAWDEEDFEVDPNDAGPQPLVVAAEPSLVMGELSQSVSCDKDFEVDPNDAGLQPFLVAAEPSLVMGELSQSVACDKASDDVDELD